MRLETIRRMSMLPFGLSVLLLLGIQSAIRSPRRNRLRPPRDKSKRRSGIGWSGKLMCCAGTASSTRQWMPLSGP